MSSYLVDSAFFVFTFIPVSPAVALLFLVVIWLFFSPGGVAWALSRAAGTTTGPPGIVFALSGTSAHRNLSKLARSLNAEKLMAFSVGLTRFIISSNPETAKEILNSSSFADRPIKESAYELLFHRAMGFAPFGEYWRNLRRISATHLFSRKRLSTGGDHRRSTGNKMVEEIKETMMRGGEVEIRRVLHFGALDNILMSLFGRSFDFAKADGLELEEMVKEGYELLSVFNWGDHLPLVGWFDLQGVRRRCKKLVKHVEKFVGEIIEEHRKKRGDVNGIDGDFADVLLDLQEEEKLSDPDMVAFLWEMIFRGTDTVAILLEWIIARMVLHPDIQSKAQAEIDALERPVTDADIHRLLYLQSIVKESLRLHPPGPLLSWARLAIHDVHVSDHFIPAGTTAMVNMYAITHDEKIWPEAEEFKPERFMEEEVNILGSDLRLAPFGSGRRVCPGKSMALATVHLWLAQLLQNFNWVADGEVDLSECLKMSMEMKTPLICKAVPRSRS